MEAELGALMPRRERKRKMRMHADDEERRTKRLGIIKIIPFELNT